MAGGAGGGGIASGTVLATHHHQVSAYGALCHARLPLVALCSRRLSSAPACPDCSDRTCHVKSRWQAMAGGGGGGGIGSGTVPATHHHQVSTCGALCHARLPLGRAVLSRPVWCTSCSDCDSDLTSRWQATAGGGGGGGIASGTVPALQNHQVRACGALCNARLRVATQCSRRLSSAPARPGCTDRACHINSR